jgi:hypothetical protein
MTTSQEQVQVQQPEDQKALTELQQSITNLPPIERESIMQRW